MAVSSTKLRERVQTRSPGALLELFVVEIPEGVTFRVHNGTKVKRFQGEDYQPYPLKAEGWEYTGSGVLPRPHMTVTNIDGALSDLMRSYNDLIGAVVTRKRTLAEFLDGKPTSDGTQEYPTDVFTVDSKIAEQPETVEFELISPIDNENVAIPGRQVKATKCGWTFRSPEGCGYDGEPKIGKDLSEISGTVDRGLFAAGTVYDFNDAVYTLSGGIKVYWVSLTMGNIFPLTDPTAWILTLCPKRLANCKTHFGANEPLPFEGFPGSAKLPRG